MTAEQRDLLSLLGYFFLQNALPEKAETVFAAIVALEPANARGATSLACAQVRAGRAEAAVAILDRLLERGHIDPAVHLLRGQALAQLGRNAESARALQAYVASRPAPAAIAAEGA